MAPKSPKSGNIWYKFAPNVQSKGLINLNIGAQLENFLYIQQ